MNCNKRVRQIQRWLSIAFTLTVIANLIAMTLGTPPAWSDAETSEPHPLILRFTRILAGLISLCTRPFAVCRWPLDPKEVHQLKVYDEQIGMATALLGPGRCPARF